ncbi:hypothetical protein KIN20_019836 [Parelaphostrongylus tenuis]|uniref:Uncharacterized protein n=1 Tax=Parelaphostrongylus tenuis TaxID=148309 RepID=A0AAD5QQF9_PARTN|nr:hypothetical protein KIN20_019836 [Parelaphostrongylus tenuis]
MFSACNAMKDAIKDADQPDRGTLSTFPHFHSKYKCCCETVHVKQGTLIIGIVCSIFTLFGLFSMIFSRESIEMVMFELVYLALDAITLVLLFVAILKDKKIFLIPFFLNQIVSVLLCSVLAILCIWAFVDPENFVGVMIEDSIISKEEMEMEKSYPEAQGTMFVRLTAAFLATAFTLILCLTFWWLVVVYRWVSLHSLVRNTSK